MNTAKPKRGFRMRMRLREELIRNSVKIRMAKNTVQLNQRFDIGWKPIE